MDETEIRIEVARASKVKWAVAELDYSLRYKNGEDIETLKIGMRNAIKLMRESLEREQKI